MAATSQRILSLQTMRLFAALGVVQYHIWFNYLGVSIGHPGTDFFLVLVAVVAAFTQARYIPSGQWGTYLRARYIRLYVTYVPVFLLVLATKWDEASLGWVLRSFFFLPIPGGEFPVVSVTWMLSMFVLFYWIFSMAFLARREWILAPIFAIWAAGIVAYTWLNWRPSLPAEWTVLFFQARNLDFILGYIVGIILRRKMLTLNLGRAIFWTGVAGLIVGVVLLNTTPPSHATRLFVGVATALFVLGLATLEQHRATDLVVRAVTVPWLVWLGATSYVLYLTHTLYLAVWDAVLPITPILVPLITVGAVLVGAVGYRYWEAPILANLKERYGLRLG